MDKIDKDKQVDTMQSNRYRPMLGYQLVFLLLAGCFILNRVTNQANEAIQTVFMGFICVEMYYSYQSSHKKRYLFVFVIAFVSTFFSLIDYLIFALS